MTILIAPIGVDTNHVKTWLREVSGDAEVLWLLHSKKDEKHDFPKIAKNLEKDIKKTNDIIKINRKVISDAFSIEPTLNAIAEIITYEQEQDKEELLIPKDFILNVTGGTNVVAAATMVAATWYGTKAHYVLMKFPGDERRKKYVIDLPVKSIGTAKKLKDNDQKVLKIIAENQYVIENTPIGIDTEPIKGMITNQQLLSDMGWEKRKTTTLNSITKRLEEQGYIENLGYVEFYALPNGKRLEANKKLDPDSKKPRIILDKQNNQYVDWPLEIKQTKHNTTFKITTVGKHFATYSMKFD